MRSPELWRHCKVAADLLAGDAGAGGPADAGAGASTSVLRLFRGARLSARALFAKAGRVAEGRRFRLTSNKPYHNYRNLATNPFNEVAEKLRTVREERPFLASGLQRLTL